MRFILGLALATSAFAQAPAIDPRGVVDYFHPTPAPATVARGAIISISGANLGPAKAVTAPTTATTLPTTLGNPAVEALINGEAMPLFSVSATQIIAQVPYDANLATLPITVSVGGVTGTPAVVTVVATQPSIQTVNGLGTGVYAGTLASNTITLAVTGLGVTKPVLNAGVLPPRTGAAPSTAILVYVGGVRTTSVAAASATKVGVFDVKFNVPPTAQPGDLIYVVSAGRPSNPVLYQALSAPSLTMQPIPSGSPTFVGLTTPDISGFFVLPYAATDATGCAAAMWFDMNAGVSGAMNPCLALPTRTATTPLVLPANSEVAGGLAGPAAPAPAGISSTVVIASADDDSVNSVSLAGAASTLAGNIDAVFVAAIPGPPAETQTINGITDVVNTLAAAGGGATGAAAAPVSVNVNGLSYIVTTPVAVAPGEFGVVVADNPIVATQAVYAVVRSNGTVVASQAFPTGWLPLIPTMASPTGADVVAASHLDTAGLVYYVLVRAPGAANDAFLVFPEDASAPPSMSPMPAGWYAASCDGAVRMLVSSLYPALVLAGVNVPDTSYSNPCQSAGFLSLDLNAQAVSSYPIDGQMSVSSLTNYNEFMFATDTTPAARNTATTVYVLDGASFAQYSIPLPAGSLSFSGTQEVAGTNWLLATVTNQTAGDGGLVQFDLEGGTATVFPVPQGFSGMQLVATFLATNKIATRALVQGSTNYQLMVFDLASGSFSMVQNPDGVASFGPPVGNPKANTVAALALDGNRNQIGILLVRVP